MSSYIGHHHRTMLDIIGNNFVLNTSNLSF